ncbi:VOC family protein [Agrococcus sp. HG114]|uniref:VOC family protein n=1 Tax=Agrococcus sp. HG114 TaxID=2969757 RepID=UPI00215AB6A3|nr:VOC family protein [Agrococcus sp. HG114]MCR8670790.1 VOC family protein [Agrococcus sp. HG114]
MDYTQGFSSFAAPDLAAAKRFYTDVLGLEVQEPMEGILGLVLPGGARVMIYQKDDHRPAVFTVLSLGVADLRAAVDALGARGATWERYEGFEQDERGIVSNPDFGPDIAWTTDPAGNIVALMQLEPEAFLQG